MITLAFYKGRGNTVWERVQDCVIRFATGGRYSHVEFIAGAAKHGATAMCLSSSARDGGVRAKWIMLRPESWDLVELNIDARAPDQFIRARIGAPYDYFGVVLSQVLALGRHDQSRWFCSEICAAALGLDSPERLSPQLLFEVITWAVEKPQTH